MPWEDINPIKVSQLANADLLAALKGNIEYLKTPNYAEYHHPGTGSDYTASTLLGLAVDLDSTNFNLTIESYGGPVLAFFYGVFSVSASYMSLNILHDDPISHIGRSIIYDHTWHLRRTVAQTLGGIVPFLGLKAGSHNFRVAWSTASGATATCHVEHRPYFAVVGW